MIMTLKTKIFMVMVWLNLLLEYIFNIEIKYLSLITFVLFVGCFLLDWSKDKKKFKNVKQEERYKTAIYITQLLAFGSLIVGMYINNYYLLLITAVGLPLSIFMRARLPKKEGKTVEEKIKNELAIVTKTKYKNLPTRFIGGFVMPALPVFAIINKRWRKHLDDEAVIHENVHLYYLQNGAILIYFLLVLLPLGLLGLFNIELAPVYENLIVLPFIIFSFVLFEWVTFRRTNFFGDKFGIKTRKWDKKIALMYIIIYSIQVGFFVGVYFLIKFLWSLL